MQHGETAYELAGQPGRPVVVLVHGFSLGMAIWEPTFQSLVRAGFRALRYDLYGRGGSAQPGVEYSAALYTRQLHELLHHLEILSPVHLVGLSMGGPIVVNFLAKYPERISTLTLIDPAGFPMPYGLLLRLAEIRGLGEWFLKNFGVQIAYRSIPRKYFQAPWFGQIERALLKQVPQAGYRRALLSSIRNGLLDRQADAYLAAGKLAKPTLLIWGREDRLAPFAHSRKVLKAMPHARLVAVKGAGHIPHLEQPEFVNDTLIQFFTDHADSRYPG